MSQCICKFQETSNEGVQSTQGKSTVSSGSGVNVLHKKLKSKLFSLEFGQSAGQLILKVLSCNVVICSCPLPVNGQWAF